MATAVFIGYDIPLAQETKWNLIMEILDRHFESRIYEGDVIHLVNSKSDIKFIQDLLFAFNEHREISLTTDIFGLNKDEIVIEEEDDELI
jgi:hypothetical protein